MFEKLTENLAGTAFSHEFAIVEWLVPTVQTIHILGIAIVLATLLMLNYKALKTNSAGPRLCDMSRSFAPWTWSALLVLLISGSLLVVAEPARELSSNSFRIKMLLVIALALLTLSMQLPLRRDPQYWDISVARRRLLRVIAAASLLLCVCIVAAGRLIAYLEHS